MKHQRALTVRQIQRCLFFSLYPRSALDCALSPRNTGSLADDNTERRSPPALSEPQTNITFRYRILPFFPPVSY